MRTTHTESSTGHRINMDPIKFEVMRSAFAAAADEMGAALRKSAYSTNIKTSMSRMVPNAVKLFGAERLQPGDAIAFNDSHNGAMHLNDIAIIAPLFYGDQLAGYAASVAHHVDIGGMAPGGLSISTDIYQEGVIIPPVRLLRETHRVLRDGGGGP